VPAITAKELLPLQISLIMMAVAASMLSVLGVQRFFAATQTERRSYGLRHTGSSEITI
jgi:hypothetical protein